MKYEDNTSKSRGFGKLVAVSMNILRKFIKSERRDVVFEESKLAIAGPWGICRIQGDRYRFTERYASKASSNDRMWQAPSTLYSAFSPTASLDSWTWTHGLARAARPPLPPHHSCLEPGNANVLSQRCDLTNRINSVHRSWCLKKGSEHSI